MAGILLRVHAPRAPSSRDDPVSTPHVPFPAGLAHMTASAETTPSPSAIFSGLHKITFVDIILWGLRIAIVAVVVGGTIGTLIKGTYSGEQWLDFFLFGLTIGGVYALI